MFPGLNSEQKCYTDRNPGMRIEQLTRTIKYLEKENRDLSMDLEDVETSLTLSKNMINILTDPMGTNDENKKLQKIIEDHQKEIDHLKDHLEITKKEKDELKSTNLLLEQVNNDKNSKEEETIAFFEAENLRVVEALEKKEYTLQLLESRLYDCEKFLRELGRSDETIRMKLKGLKLNPDVDRKKITNVVLQNDKLMEQIDVLVEENDKLTQKVNELEQKNRTLKQTVEARPSLIGINEDLGNISDKDMTRVFEALDVSVNFTQKITNVKKLLPIMDANPALFSKKLLNNYRVLEQKFINVHKDLNEYKGKYRIMEEKHKILEDNHRKLSKNYEKLYNTKMNKNGELKKPLPVKADGGGTGTLSLGFSGPKNPNLFDFGKSQERKKPQNAYEVLDSIKNMELDQQKGVKNSPGPQFQDISSILIAPKALNNQQDLSSDEEIDHEENILDAVEEDNEGKE